LEEEQWPLKKREKTVAGETRPRKAKVLPPNLRLAQNTH